MASISSTRTPLYDMHLAYRAKMGTFAGYMLPLYYAPGAIAEHQHVRRLAGLFDISHMGQIQIQGRGAGALLEKVLPSALENMPVGLSRYTLWLNDHGGIVDDVIVARHPDPTTHDQRFMLVVNAAKRTEKAQELQRLLPELAITLLTDRSLLALQGPCAAERLGTLCPEICHLAFMHGKPVTLDGKKCTVTRCGYTGEDGFEISVASTDAPHTAEVLLDLPDVQWSGLAARNSLRLEAGLCLYGEDIDAHITPAMAGLSFCIHPQRRQGAAKSGGFIGAPAIFAQQPPSRHRVGLKGLSRAPLHGGTQLFTDNDTPIGRVSSATYAPTIGTFIGMGYVDAQLSSGTIRAMVRNRSRSVDIVPLPFIPPRYHRPPIKT